MRESYSWRIKPVLPDRLFALELCERMMRVPSWQVMNAPRIFSDRIIKGPIYSNGDRTLG